MKRLPFLLFCLIAGMATAYAQIGYQISLLNTATGEPRANENVSVTASLSNSDGQVFYTTTQQAKTNDFGVLSLSIGEKDTFSEVDLTKMPFFIEVTANGVLIGKSQILSVPVAEVAKRVAPLDKEKIIGTWYTEHSGYNTCYSFHEDGTAKCWEEFLSTGRINYIDETCNYYVDGNNIYICHGRVNGLGITYWHSTTLNYHNGYLWGEYRYTKQTQ